MDVDDISECFVSSREMYDDAQPYLNLLVSQGLVTPGVDESPKLLKPGSGRALCCSLNCTQQLTEHPELYEQTLVRGFKVVLACMNKRTIGVKCIPHIVLRQKNTRKLIDVTQESDDRIDQPSSAFKCLFVPAHAVHSELSDDRILNGASLISGTIAFGEENYVDMVKMDTELRKLGVLQ